MFSLIKQIVTVLLSFSSSFGTKFVSFNDELWMVRPTFINLNPIEIEFCPFLISLDKWNGSCIVLLPKVCVPNRFVARNLWGQETFLKIRAQIINSCKRLNYIQIPQRTSLKNNYLDQIWIILADIQTQPYNFMIKRFPGGFKICTREMFVFLYRHFGVGGAQR